MGRFRRLVSIGQTVPIRSAISTRCCGLVLDDGGPLAESNAILFQLARRTPYLLDDWYESAQMRWLFFEPYRHEPLRRGAGARQRSEIDDVVWRWRAERRPRVIRCSS